MRFMDCQLIIWNLCDHLRDKSKVHISCGVAKVVCDADGVAVEAAGGSVFHGDIVVGAVGIHSKVRQEMQRITSEEASGNDLFRDEEGELSFAIGSIDRRVGLAFWPAFSSYTARSSSIQSRPQLSRRDGGCFLMQYCRSRFNSSESSLRVGLRPLQLLVLRFTEGMRGIYAVL